MSSNKACQNRHQAIHECYIYLTQVDSTWRSPASNSESTNDWRASTSTARYGPQIHSNGGERLSPFTSETRRRPTEWQHHVRRTLHSAGLATSICSAPRPVRCAMPLIYAGAAATNGCRPSRFVKVCWHHHAVHSFSAVMLCIGVVVD